MITALLIIILAGPSDAGIPLPDMKAGMVALGLNSDKDYAVLQSDRQGRLLFTCRGCPTQFCKHMACRFAFEDDDIAGKCECRWPSPTRLVTCRANNCDREP